MFIKDFNKKNFTRELEQTFVIIREISGGHLLATNYANAH